MLQEFVKQFPLISIIVFSFIITVIFLLAQKKFTNQEKMKELREKQKEIQEKSKQFKDKPDKILELQQEMMNLSTQQMRESLKLTFITLIPLIFIFNWLRDVFVQAGVGNIIYWKVNVPIFGDGAGWLLSYIIFSIIFSLILRKFMKVY